MDRTAQQLHNDFHGKLVKIRKADGEKIIGIIMLAAGLEKAGTLVPKTSFIQVDAILDIEAYKKDPQSYEHEFIIIHPDDIANIREYDLLNLPVQMSYADFQNILSGINPTYLAEVTEEVKDGKAYIVHHEDAKYKIVHQNNQLSLQQVP